MNRYMILLIVLTGVIGCTSITVHDTEGTARTFTAIKGDVAKPLQNAQTFTDILSAINPLYGGLATALITGLGAGFGVNNQAKKKMKKVKHGARVASEIIEEHIKGTESWASAKAKLKNAAKHGAINVDIAHI